MSQDTTGSPWECQHPRTERRRRTQRNGVEVHVLQCLECGRAVRNVPKNTWDGAGQPRAFDDALFETKRAVWHARWLAHVEAQQQERTAAYQAEQDAKNREWWRWYNQYLTTAQWKAKRALVMERAGGICEGCRTRKAVQVHHLTYEHVGDELLFELVALCGACHQKIHPEMEVL